MVILGLDPGFASLGWALLDASGARPRCLAAGVIRTKKDGRTSIARCDDNARRLAQIACELDELHKAHRFAIIAAEAQSWTRFAASDRATAMVWGAIAAVAELFNCPVVQLRPQDVKKQITGDASASKAALETACHHRIGDAEKVLATVKPDSQRNHAADALAVALASLDHRLIQAVRRLG